MNAKERAVYIEARSTFQPSWLDPSKPDSFLRIDSAPNPETIKGLRRIGCTKRAALIIAAALAAMDAEQANADHVARFLNASAGVPS